MISFAPVVRKEPRNSPAARGPASTGARSWRVPVGVQRHSTSSRAHGHPGVSRLGCSARQDVPQDPHRHPPPRPPPSDLSQTAMLFRLRGMDTQRKAVVVGGGPAGLVAAGRLAEGGVETTLLEAASNLGGRAASEHRDGFDLNQGPHALYVGGPAMRELRAMGVDLPRWNPASPASVFVRDGKPRRLLGGEPALARWLFGLLRSDPQAL